MEVVIVNNTSETFTPTESGAIATHIWECCRAARRSGAEPLVISRKATAQAYADTHYLLVDHPWVPKQPLVERLFRIERKLTGWRHLRQRAFAERIANVIIESRLENAALILHNDPELAVFLRGKFPRAFIVHHFHNLLECKPRFRKRFAGSVNAITAVSEFTSRWVENYYACRPVVTIYNGVDSERFKPSETQNSGTPIINFTGRTGIEKAPDILLRSACQLIQRTKAFRLQILGSNHWHKFEWDDYQATLTDLADQLQCEGISVDRPGHVDRRSLPGKLQCADIHVVPSRWDEPFGLVTTEGMASGLATVASRTGGTAEIVGDAGLLFERESVSGLTEHLYSLVKDRNLRISYGKRARDRALMFTWEKTWESFCGVLK